MAEVVDYKRTIAALTIALNTNNATTIHEIITKFQEQPTAIKGIAAELIKDQDIAFAVKKSLTLQGAGAKDDDVCQWLYNWYQIDSSETRIFVLQFLPLIIWSYLYSLSQNDILPGIEACLLCIYNNEVILRNGQDLTFNPPSLSVPSYLHRHPFTTHQTDLNSGTLVLPDGASNAGGGGGGGNSGVNPTLTENALRQFNKQAKVVVTDKRIDALEVVTSGTRPIVLKVALKKYNAHISNMPNASLHEYCKMCKRLASCGFDFSRITPSILHSKAFADKHPEEKDQTEVVSRDDDDEDDDDNNDKADYDEGGDESSSDDEDNEVKIFLNGEVYKNDNVNKVKGKAKVRVEVHETHTAISDNSRNHNKVISFSKKPRIVLSPLVLQELVSGLTFCVFKGDTHKRAVHALSLVHLRASHDLIPEVILSVNSLLQLDFNEQKASNNNNNNNNFPIRMNSRDEIAKK